MPRTKRQVPTLGLDKPSLHISLGQPLLSRNRLPGVAFGQALRGLGIAVLG
jgi:hypothetical protein